MDATISLSLLMGNPSSTIMASSTATGLAPMTAVSFTAPHTASLPRSPPGKKMGSTVWPSVLRITSMSPILMLAPSSSASSGMPFMVCLVSNSLRNISWMRVSSVEPPAPWLSFTVSSLIGISHMARTMHDISC